MMLNLMIPISLLVVIMIYVLNLIIKRDGKYTDVYIFIVCMVMVIAIFALIIITFIPNLKGTFKSDYQKCVERYYVESKRREVTIDGRELFYVKFKAGDEIETTRAFYDIAEPGIYIKEKNECTLM